MKTRERNGRSDARSGRRDGAGVGGAAPTDSTSAGDLRYAVGDCVLGAVLVASTERGLRAVILGDDEAAVMAEFGARFRGPAARPGDAATAGVLAAVAAAIESSAAGFAGPLDPGGTEFQRAVWAELRRIPAGETATYAEVARRVGRPAAVRAVGAACGANPLAVIVPCHRVVGSDGRLTGYRWGLARKRRLLELESRAHGKGIG